VHVWCKIIGFYNLEFCPFKHTFDEPSESTVLLPKVHIEVEPCESFVGGFATLLSQALMWILYSAQLNEEIRSRREERLHPSALQS
jgi:hypothetical protein